MQERIIKGGVTAVGLSFLAGCGLLQPPHAAGYEYTVTVTAPPTTGIETTETATPSVATPSVVPTTPAPAESPLPEPPEVVPAKTDAHARATVASGKLTEGCGNAGPEVLLTFDDGASVSRIRAIAKILLQKDVGAIMFVNSNRVSDKMVDELRQEGFWVGNHTKDHADISHSSVTQIKAAITNGTPSNVFRPPFGGFTSKGLFNKNIDTAAKELNVRVCDWKIDPEDWSGISAARIKQRVFKHLEPSAEVLLHLDGESTLTALPRLIDGIRARGFSLCSHPTFATTENIPAVLPCSKSAAQSNTRSAAE